MWPFTSKRRPARIQPAQLPLDDNFRQMSFTFAVIALSARVACADGTLTREKYMAFRDSFPLESGVCGKIRSLFTLACDNRTPYMHYLSQVSHLFPHNKELFISLLDRLYRIAAADGHIAREAEIMLTAMAHRLGLNAAEHAALRARHNRPASARQILGLGKRTGANALKLRYRELMRRYHPDHLANADLSPEVQMLLKLKASQINEAYRRLSKKAA